MTHVFLTDDDRALIRRIFFDAEPDQIERLEALVTVCLAARGAFTPITTREYFDACVDGILDALHLPGELKPHLLAYAALHMANSCGGIQ